MPTVGCNGNQNGQDLERIEGQLFIVELLCYILSCPNGLLYFMVCRWLWVGSSGISEALACVVKIGQVSATGVSA